MRTAAPIVPILLAAFLLPATAVHARELTFDERVRIQEAIERIYYSHRVGVTRAFVEAVPRQVLEEKVRTYLKQSVALREFWNRPVTGEALERELERIAARTRLPQRLREIYQALDHDSFLIQECFARLVLVNRLARSYFATDERIHRDQRQEAEDLHRRLVSGAVDVSTDDPRRQVLEIVHAEGAGRRGSVPFGAQAIGLQSAQRGTIELGPEEFRRWRARAPAGAGEIGSVAEERSEFVVRVTLATDVDRVTLADYHVPKITWDQWWAEIAPDFDERSTSPLATRSAALPAPAPSGARIWGADTNCAPDDTWDNGILEDAPIERRGHTAVWTGSEMIVWGGVGVESLRGARYDPLTATWTPISTVNSPEGDFGDTAIWTGSEMIAWGGDYMSTGGRYDPVSDTWVPTSTLGAPSGRVGHTAIWTGSVMIIWGGTSGTPFHRTGGRYDPASDTWAPTTLNFAPVARSDHMAVWTGSEMIVWGGRDGSVEFDSGGRYDPVANIWNPILAINTPEARADHVAVWTGSEMIVWGGSQDRGFTPLNTGARYDPVSDTWTAISTTNAPDGRNSPVAVWTGDEMIIWGGQFRYGEGQVALDTGGRYDPAIDSWTPTSAANAPSPRATSGVWTGSEMIIWGGNPGSSSFGTIGLNTGGRYDPATDTWAPTEAADAPETRRGHTAVWTGSEMIIWGGGQESQFGVVNTGARYDPLTDAWTPTSMANAPTARSAHPGVWTGSEMIIWGGPPSSATGGRYDPIADVWTPTSTTGSPQARSDHTAVWTGSEMIVWGGSRSTSFKFDTGGRYDPATDTWVPTTITSAPVARAFHSAIWTGSEMIVWGGLAPPTKFDTGARYDPETDNWTLTSTSNAPAARSRHSAIWTGNEMIVWGGHVGQFGSDTGGLYDPATDNWSPTSTTDAPAARTSHIALWTGSEMIIWGASSTATGGRYDPSMDAWSETSLINAPLGMFLPTGVWTGNAMIVWGYRRGGAYFVGSPVDDDSDGFCISDGDCDDNSANIWRTPGEVESVLLPDSLTLTWTAPSDLGGTSVLYDTIRSSNAADFDVGATCVAFDISGTSATGPTHPLVGSAFFYLIRAENDCPGVGLGSLGTDSNGTPRTGRSCP